MKTNEQTLKEIENLIEKYCEKIGYYNGYTQEFEVVDSLENYLDALAFPFEMNEVSDITLSDIQEAITEQIYQRCSVIGYHHAWQLIWNYGLAESQEIADEYGIEKPLEDAESIATIILQRRLEDDLYNMADDIQAILDRAKAK